MKSKKSIKWAAILISQIFVFPVVALAQTPTLVYSNSLAAPGESGNGFRIQYGGAMGTGTLPGNLLTLRMTYPHGATVSSIADSLSDTYILGVSTDSGSGGWVTALYYVPGVAAGVKQITITFSSGVTDWHGAVQEYSGVTASTPGDGSCSNHSTTVKCSAAITTTGNNDLIVASAIGLGSGIRGNTMTSVAPGGGFFLDSADTNCSDADEESVQASAGSITPAFAITGNSEVFNIVGMAFKASAGAGTNPTGMYILHEQHLQIGEGSNTQVSYFVSSGNLVVASSDVGSTNSGGNIITIDTCTPSNTWTKRTPSGTDMPQILFIPSAAVSTNLQCTVHSSQPTDTGIIVVYDVVGAASSPEDVDSAGLYASGTALTNLPDITPTAQPGIAFAAENTGTGPSTAVGSGFLWDNTPYTGETDQGQLNNGDGWQHFFYTSTSQIPFSWTQAVSSSTMQAFAIAFKAGNQGAPTTVAVTVSPATDSINVDTTLEFAATVTGSTNTSVAWSTTCGTINSSGLYTAPSTASSCTVTATSIANGADSASANVTVSAGPPPTVVVAISPASGSINVNTTLQFTATVTGSTNSSVTWSANCGTINSNGLYTAPATASSCKVIATSVANAADSASATVVAIAGPPQTVVVTINPRSQSISVNRTLEFTATVTGTTNTSVAWSATCGTINSSGLYTAPSTTSSCTVTATSIANGAYSASASVTVRRRH